MNCLWIILLLFGCGNGWSRNGGCGCGCGNSCNGLLRSNDCDGNGCGRDRDCGCDNDFGRDRDCGCDNDRGRDRDCDCDNDFGREDGVRRIRRDLDYDVKSARYPNVSRSSETCGCEKSDQSEQ